MAINVKKKQNSNMKKTYQNPVIKVVKIQTTQMLATSPGYGGNTEQTYGNLAPEFNIWDEE